MGWVIKEIVGLVWALSALAMFLMAASALNRMLKPDSPAQWIAAIWLLLWLTWAMSTTGAAVSIVVN